MATADKAPVPASSAGDDDEMVEVLFQGLPVRIKASLDPLTLQRRITERVFAARSLDEAFAVWEAQSSDELEGRVCVMAGVRWGVFTSPETAQRLPLAEVQTVDDDGEVTSGFVTTASNLVAFLAAADQGGWFPFKARIVGEKTSNGRTALRFARA